MRWRSLLALVLVFACESSKPPAPTKKPPDNMDERMRHCPLALEGARTQLADIPEGVRFTVRIADASQLTEARRRAQHIVEFASRKTRAGHGEFDGKGGGRMKNCPVVTDDVTIVATDVDGGVQLDVTTTRDVAALRTESRARAAKFPFVGASIDLTP